MEDPAVVLKVVSTPFPEAPDRPAVRKGVRLLEIEPDLGANLTELECERARREVVLPVAEIPVGAWELHTLEATSGVLGHVYGLLVISGSITLEVSVARRSCVRLITSGEIVLLDGIESDSIPSRWGWATLEPTRVAIFDRRTLAIGRRWPLLLGAILIRAARQTRQAHLQQAISQLPRVEDRLVALFWSLADRVGVMRPNGICIHLPLTHDMIARMIGARRPTVSLGLGQLAEQGVLTRDAGGWLLSTESIELLQPPS